MLELLKGYTSKIVKGKIEILIYQEHHPKK